MDKTNCLYAKDSGKLQMPYDEYMDLMKKVEQARRLQQVKDTVFKDLHHFLEGGMAAKAGSAPRPEPVVEPQPSPVKEPEMEKVSIEFATEQLSEPENQPAAAMARVDISQVPPIKKDIIEHFNKLDESGRLFNVFKQYYTLLNDACGSTVRVTMKDGFCSLWNYDEWEEFAFVDVFEGLLRIAVNPRYTDALKSLNLCEAPRLISSRRNVICVQVDDLNNAMLDVLSKAFTEAGMKIKQT